MATPPDSGLSTPEYLAFRKCYMSVKTHICPQTGYICGALFEIGYIPTDVRIYATTYGIPNDKKAQTLVDTVIDKVGVDPSVFHGFMSILKNEGPWADSIVKQLEEAFRAEQALADCDHSSEGSFHSLPDPDSTTGGTAKEPEPQNMSVQALAASSEQKTEEFISACKEGSIDKLINVCLKSLGIKGEAATELRGVALEKELEGDISSISHLVRESGINLDERDAEYGGTALFWSSLNGHNKIAEILIECGASLNVQKKEGYTALHVACQNGHDDTVKILMRAKADLNLQTNVGVTALFLASQGGHVTTVQLLVEAGASLDVQRNAGWTPLKQASFYGHHKVVDVLTNAGASLDMQDEKGYTALHVACQSGHDDTVKILMRAKADLNLQTNRGFTALHLASEDDRLTTVLLLVEAGASLDVQTNDGCTALYAASYKGHHKVVDLLTNAGAIVDVQNEEGWSALHVACQNGHDDTFKILMRAKADLNLQTNEGVTALFLACQNGHVTTVQLLVEAGASLDVQRNDGWTALDVATQFQGADSTVVGTLTKAGAKSGKQLPDSSAIHLTSEKSHLQTEGSEKD